MKRERESDPCLHDPVLAQLDFLINGPPKAVRGPEDDARMQAPPPSQPPQPSQPPPPLLRPLSPAASLPTPDPVLAQLDALINGGAPAAIASTSTENVQEDEDDAALRGPPGLLREFGGVRGWMARHFTGPVRTTP